MTRTVGRKRRPAARRLGRETTDSGTGFPQQPRRLRESEADAAAELRPRARRAACRKPSIPTGRSPSTTGRWWIPYSFISLSAVSSRSRRTRRPVRRSSTRARAPRSDGRARRRRAAGRATSGSRSAGRSRRQRPSRCRAPRILSLTSPSVSSGATTSGSADMTSPTVAPSPLAVEASRRSRPSTRSRRRPARPRSRPRRRRRRLGWALEAGDSRRGTGRGSGRRSSPAATRAAPGSTAVGLTGAGELAAEVARPAAGQEQPAQHRPERLRPDVDAGCAAIASAAASAIWVAMPPCLTGKVVTSPAA